MRGGSSRCLSGSTRTHDHGIQRDRLVRRAAVAAGRPIYDRLRRNRLPRRGRAQPNARFRRGDSCAFIDTATSASISLATLASPESCRSMCSRARRESAIMCRSAHADRIVERLSFLHRQRCWSFLSDSDASSFRRRLRVRAIRRMAAHAYRTRERDRATAARDRCRHCRPGYCRR